MFVSSWQKRRWLPGADKRPGDDHEGDDHDGDDHDDDHDHDDPDHDDGGEVISLRSPPPL